MHSFLDNIKNVPKVALVGLGLKKLKDIQFSKKEIVKGIQKNDLVIVTVTDADKIEHNQDTYFIYHADLITFITMIKSCVYTKNDKLAKYKELKYGAKYLLSEDRIYYKYLDDNIIDLENLADFSLFRFYCRGYLNFKYNTEQAKGKDYNKDRNFYYTQSGVLTLKMFMDKFINAYFASKDLLNKDLKEVIKNQNAFNNLNLLNETSRFIFISNIKLGLILQGISVETANKLVRGFK